MHVRAAKVGDAAAPTESYDVACGGGDRGGSGQARRGVAVIGLVRTQTGHVQKHVSVQGTDTAGDKSTVGCLVGNIVRVRGRVVVDIGGRRIGRTPASKNNRAGTGTVIAGTQFDHGSSTGGNECGIDVHVMSSAQRDRGTGAVGVERAIDGHVMPGGQLDYGTRSVGVERGTDEHVISSL